MRRLLYEYYLNDKVIFRGSATRMIDFANTYAQNKVATKEDAIFFIRGYFKGGELKIKSHNFN